MTSTSQRRLQRREALLRAAIELIGEQGLSQVRVADVAERAGISPGHVLYYFEGKADLFAQALRMVEQDLRDDYLAHAASLPTAAERWRYLIEAAAPTGPGDARLLLWLEAWELAPRDEDVAQQVHDLEQRWQTLVLDILRLGIDTGEIHTADPEGFVTRFSALMDGLTIQVVIGSTGVDREKLLAICHEIARTELGLKLS
ncbi:MAG TPA: TetR/AcrR family transcriptional regulator [Conexibacter sp.]|nr:TetR/AcrR family transcriptional regulator [Conexibacter sp.]